MSGSYWTFLCKPVPVMALILILPRSSESAAPAELVQESPTVLMDSAPIPGANLLGVGLEHFRQWNRVRQFILEPENMRRPELRPWVEWAQTLSRRPVRERLAAINGRVGDRIAYATDDAIWRRANYWEDPLEVVRKGATDCEGFASLKMALAIAAGIDREALAIVVGRISASGTFHAVLVARMDGRRYILDNLRSGMSEVGEPMDFEPIYAVDTVRAWSFPPWPSPAPRSASR